MRSATALSSALLLAMSVQGQIRPSPSAADTPKSVRASTPTGTRTVVRFNGSSALQAADLPAKPNLVVILADDLGYGDVQCYNPQRGKIPTPNLDRLAAQGMTVTRAYSASPLPPPKLIPTAYPRSAAKPIAARLKVPVRASGETSFHSCSTVTPDG